MRAASEAVQAAPAGGPQGAASPTAEPSPTKAPLTAATPEEGGPDAPKDGGSPAVKPAANPFTGMAFNFGGSMSGKAEAAPAASKPFQLPPGGFKFGGSPVGGSGGFAGFAGGGGAAAGGFGGGFKKGGGFGALKADPNKPVSLFGGEGAGKSASGTEAAKGAEPGATAAAASSPPKLEVQPATTGEEGEDTVFKGAGRLFEFVPQGETSNPRATGWVERGKGVIHVNVVEGSQARLVMRADGTKRLLLNCKLWPEMLLTVMGGKRGVTFSAQNHTDIPADQSDKSEEKPQEAATTSTFAIRMQFEAALDEFIATVDKKKTLGGSKGAPGVEGAPEDGANGRADAGENV